MISFGPDLIAMSTTEDMFTLGISLLTKIKDLNCKCGLAIHPNIKIININKNDKNL